MDLSTKYLGLNLKSPLVVSASPLSEDIGNIRKMEDSGAAAVVMHSLFEEQIAVESMELDRSLSLGESYAESLSYFPDLSSYNMGPDGYLEQIARAKAAVKIPIIASLNGTSSGGWTRFAKKMEEAGADALELNIYTIPTNADVTGEQVVQSHVDLVSQVKASVGIPVAVKLGPYFTAMANVAKRMEQAGANGLVLFNRFYQPDFDLEALEIVPSLQLSNSYELLTRLHWVAILWGHVKADLAITGGVHTSYDVLKAMMAGAQVAEMASAVLKRGIDYLNTVESELVAWMEEHEYESIKQMQGSMSQRSVANPNSFLRANYLKVLSSYSLRA
ncbi:MAG TPA: dihydroorotate dehydrogenase-like protein [Bryobacteraceae bacterium]|nr:dihydroorotate dehydrogenase-like protein [Bryobacteraceae bacterium]